MHRLYFKELQIRKEKLNTFIIITPKTPLIDNYSIFNILRYTKNRILNINSLSYLEIIRISDQHNVQLVSIIVFLWMIFVIICPVNSFPNAPRWLIDWSHSKFILINFFFLTTYNGSLAVLYGDRLYRRKKNIQRHDIEFIYYFSGLLRNRWLIFKLNIDLFTCYENMFGIISVDQTLPMTKC